MHNMYINMILYKGEVHVNAILYVMHTKQNQCFE